MYLVEAIMSLLPDKDMTVRSKLDNIYSKLLQSVAYVGKKSLNGRFRMESFSLA